MTPIFMIYDRYFVTFSKSGPNIQFWNDHHNIYIFLMPVRLICKLDVVKSLQCVAYIVNVKICILCMTYLCILVSSDVQITNYRICPDKRTITFSFQKYLIKSVVSTIKSSILVRFSISKKGNDAVNESYRIPSVLSVFKHTVC